MFALGSGGTSAFNAITQKFETTEGLGETFAANDNLPAAGRRAA